MATEGGFHGLDRASHVGDDGQPLATLVQAGEVSRDDLLAALGAFLREAPPIPIRPDLYAVLPSVDEIPDDLREALISLLMSARA